MMPKTAREFFALVTLRRDVVARRGVCQYTLAGQGGGDFYITNVDGDVALVEGVHGAPNVQVEASIQDFFDCCYGMVDFRDLFAAGRIGVRGDAFLAAEFHNRLIARPHPDIETTFALAAARTGARTKTDHLERLPFPSTRLVKEAMADSAPVIVTDAAGPLLGSSWSLGSLTDQFPDATVLVRDALMTMIEFVQLLLVGRSDGPVPYAFGPGITGGIYETLRAPPYIVGAWVASLWMGGAGSVTPLHRDFNDGFLVQAFGRKQLWLYAPDQAHLLYPATAYGRFQQCIVNPEAPDRDRFPLFAEAVGNEVTLKEGELIAIPAAWFHQVRTLDIGASVRFEQEGYDLTYYHRAVARRSQDA